MTTSLTNTDQLLAYALQGVITTSEKVGEFAIEQAPEVIQELYTWKSVSYMFGVILSLIILVGMILLANYFRKKIKEDNDYFPATVVAYAFLSIPFVVMFVNLYDFMMITIAPKVWMIEYVANLLKNK